MILMLGNMKIEVLVKCRTYMAQKFEEKGERSEWRALALTSCCTLKLLSCFNIFDKRVKQILRMMQNKALEYY